MLARSSKALLFVLGVAAGLIFARLSRADLLQVPCNPSTENCGLVMTDETAANACPVPIAGKTAMCSIAGEFYVRDTNDAAGIRLLRADFTDVQKRVAETCAAGNAIREVLVDGQVTCEPVAAADDQTAAEVPNTPAGAIAATTVQAAINELDAEKASATHVHAGADITTGALALARLTDGGTAGVPLVAGGGGGDPSYAVLGVAGIDATVIQRRVSATTCSGANLSIKTIAADGTVTCETDDGGGTGEANTHSSDGGGLALTAATPKVGVDLRLISLAASDFSVAANVATVNDDGHVHGSSTISALDASDTATGTFADARVSGAAERDEVNPQWTTQLHTSDYGSVSAFLNAYYTAVQPALTCAAGPTNVKVSGEISPTYADLQDFGDKRVFMAAFASAAYSGGRPVVTTAGAECNPSPGDFTLDMHDLRIKFDCGAGSPDQTVAGTSEQAIMFMLGSGYFSGYPDGSAQGYLGGRMANTRIRWPDIDFTAVCEEGWKDAGVFRLKRPPTLLDDANYASSTTAVGIWVNGNPKTMAHGEPFRCHGADRDDICVDVEASFGSALGPVVAGNMMALVMGPGNNGVTMPGAGYSTGGSTPAGFGAMFGNPKQVNPVDTGGCTGVSCTERGASTTGVYVEQLIVESYATLPVLYYGGFSDMKVNIYYEGQPTSACISLWGAGTCSVDDFSPCAVDADCPGANGNDCRSVDANTNVDGVFGGQFTSESGGPSGFCFGPANVDAGGTGTWADSKIKITGSYGGSVIAPKFGTRFAGNGYRDTFGVRTGSHIDLSELISDTPVPMPATYDGLFTPQQPTVLQPDCLDVSPVIMQLNTICIDNLNTADCLANGNPAPCCTGAGAGTCGTTEKGHQYICRPDNAGTAGVCDNTADIVEISAAGGTFVGGTLTADLVLSADANEGLSGGGLADCDAATTSKLLWDATTHKFSCGTDANSGSNTLVDALGDAGADGAVALNEFAQVWTWDSADAGAAFTGLTLALNADETSGSPTQRPLLVRRNATTGSSAAPSLVRVENLDTDGTVAAGILVAATTNAMMLVGVDASDAEINTALAIGANDITTAGGTITQAEFDILQDGLISLSTEITGTLGVANGGTGITALGTGVATALGVNVGSAGAFVTFNGAGGTPSAITLTNAAANSLPLSAIGTNMDTLAEFDTQIGITGTPSASTYWRGDNSWATPAGTGDVVGPGSATDNAIARYDTTTGKLLQNSGVTIDDNGVITVPATGSLAIAANATAAQCMSLQEDADNIGAGGTDPTELCSAAAIADGGVKFIWPATAGSAGEVLSTDGASPAVLSWATAGSAPSDTAYASSWNAATTIAPSKNAVYDWAHLLDADDDGLVDSLDVSAGAAPTANGKIEFDSTANDLEYGDNGTNRKVANLDEAQTFSAVKTFSAAPVLNALPTGSAVASAATASTVAARDANGTLSANSFNHGYTTTATAAGTTTLTVASTNLQYFTGSTTQTVVLPVTSTLVLGQRYVVTNLSSGAVTVQSSGANTINVLGPQATTTFTVILTSGTTAASWNVSGAFASGSVALDGSSATTGTCSTTLTTTVTGLLTTDVIGWTPNADLDLVTGFGHTTSGGMIISVWPTANTINWKLCNPTSGTLDPASFTMNYKVMR